MLQNAYFLAKIGADTAEIELHSAEMLPIGHRSRDELDGEPHAEALSLGPRRQQGRAQRLGRAGPRAEPQPAQHPRAAPERLWKIDLNVTSKLH